MESLQQAVNVATVAVNAQGPLINARLYDVPTRVREIALHGVHRGASHGTGPDRA